MNIINIVAGGPKQHIPNLHKYNTEACTWVGVDRGVYLLLEEEIHPNISFGDFDSVTAAELRLIEKEVDDLHKFKAEKDETDMELALNWAYKQKPELIRIFGATGGRLDHFFANIQLLLKTLIEDHACHVEIIDDKNIIFVKKPGSFQVEKMNEKKYISFVPISAAVEGLTLTGFKYPLTDCHIPLGSTLCISNELIYDNGTFSFTDGILMVLRSCD